MKKQWISVKCGLSRDPKHRRQMGNAVWTFLHMLDLADWETGVVYDWKDKDAAEDTGIDIRVLRDDRRKLEEADYISCRQKQYSQDITINNWTNPREYTGEVYNKKQGYKNPPPSKNTQGTPQGDTQGTPQGSIKKVTPTLDSNIKEQINPPISKTEMQDITTSANKTLDAFIGMQRNAGEYIEREKTASAAFESAFGITRPWDWYPAKSTEEKVWRDFRADVLRLYEADPACFTKYVTWMREPFAKGAKTAIYIKSNPQDFMTIWAGFLASNSMNSGVTPKPRIYDPAAEPVKNYIPAPENLRRSHG